MLSPEILATIVSVISILIASYAIYKAHKVGTIITPEFVTSSLQMAGVMATELTEVALTAVRASEQLWNTNVIDEDDRFDRAFDYVQRWFPDLDQETIVTAIEAAVLVVNTIVKSLPAKEIAE